MTDSRHIDLASRQAAGLFVVCAVLAVRGAFGPDEPPRSIDVGVAAAAIGAAVVIAALPWHRWRPSMTLWIVPVAFAVIDLFAAAELIPVRSYGVFFVIVFAWVGLHHRSGVAIRLAPLATFAYAAPLLLTEANPPVDLRAVVVAIITGVVVAETIARGQARALEAQRRSTRSAAAFREVARTSAALRQLEPEGVLDAVTEGVMNLGYDGANLSIVDTGSDVFYVSHPRGIAVHHAERRYGTSEGLAGRVLATRATVVLEDYQAASEALESARYSGTKGAIGVPVLVGDRLAGVLIASNLEPFTPHPEDVEALQILADVAGTALASAHALQRQRATAEEKSREARTDALTGLANRRQAEDLLDALRPGDALVLVDVDHFGAVNERLGHAGGDRVLIELAGHLAASVRSADVVTRFGGEEFLLLLPACGPGEASRVVTRLMATWRARGPEATFSAGIAVHRGGRSVDDTLRGADAALYSAKQAGRDRCRMADDDLAEAALA